MRASRVVSRLVMAVLTLVSMGCCAVSAQSVVRVAAAANLRYAMEQIERNYEATNPDVDLHITYGASGTFYQQIINGAPYNLFLSADDLLPQRLVEQGVAVGDSRVYACGKLALYGLRDDVDELGLALVERADVLRISVANPRTAPYGLRSVELLKSMGVWESLERKVVYGESIAQTAQFAMTGNVDVAFVALSLLLSPDVELKGSYYIIPADSYAPIAQAGVLLSQREGGEAAAKLFEYILASECKEVWAEYGYSSAE